MILVIQTLTLNVIFGEGREKETPHFSTARAVIMIIIEIYIAISILYVYHFHFIKCSKALHIVVV